MTITKLRGLRPEAYEHPSDKAALDALSNNGGFEKLVRKVHAWGFERALRAELTGSFLRVTPDTFSDIFRLLERACDTLDMPMRPDLYIAAGPMNAFTSGMDRPLIVVYSGIVDAMTEDELLFVIAHELGHIKSAHVLYYQIAEFLPALAEQAAHFTMGVSELLGAGMKLALLHWQRMSEYTADRAGLLGCQDATVALRALMKLAGLPAKYYSKVNTADFIAQAKSFEAMDSDKMMLVIKYFSEAGATHPYTVMRGKQLLDWYDSGGYERVLRTPQAITTPLPQGITSFCNRCGRPLRSGQVHCPGCGRAIGATAS
jgi:Zn-dependent protease with chaperone function